MKSLSCSVLIALTGLASASRAAAVDETNQVAIAILSCRDMPGNETASSNPFQLEYRTGCSVSNSKLSSLSIAA